MSSTIAFNPFQSAAKEVLDWDSLVESHDGISACEDGLLRFVLLELATKEGCDSEEEAIHRLDVAIKQLQDVREKINGSV